MASDYSIALAQQAVDEYSSEHDRLMAEHRDAMKCWDLDALLRSGIKAYDLIAAAEALVRKAAASGVAVSEQTTTVFDTLYRRWRDKRPEAEKLIQEMQTKGYEIENLPDFRRACTEVEQKLAQAEVYDAIEDAFQGRAFDAGRPASPTRNCLNGCSS